MVDVKVQALWAHNLSNVAYFDLPQLTDGQVGLLVVTRGPGWEVNG